MNMSTENHYDVLVIGGGPSGMMAAGRAGMLGKKVLLLEKNGDLGRKLSLTGGGRCNILNAEHDVKALLNHYGDSKKFLYTPFSIFGMKETWEFFENRGLPLVVEARKRVFPKTQRAEDVIKTMITFMKDGKVDIRAGISVNKIKTDGAKVVSVETDSGIFTADCFVLSTGGTSYPDTGSTGEGLRWLKEVGHTVKSSGPNLVPLAVKEQWIKDLSGTTLSFMKITFGADRKKKDGKFSRLGKILFTHFGLSGPLILNSSQKVKELLNDGPVKAEIDMYPDTDLRDLRKKILNTFDRNRNKNLKNAIHEVAPAGMGGVITDKLFPCMSDRKVHSINKAERDGIANLMKALPVTVTDTMGLDRAIASDGGINLSEVDTKTMRSKVLNNLYLTGDVLDVERPSGGFSLQWCWTSGWIAGSNA